MIDRPADGVFPVLNFEEIDSTNAEARRRAEAADLGPLWITAGRQAAGRGRRGRTWETGRGNLAATLLISLPKAPAEAALVSFVTALAVADLARQSVPDGLVRLKWPNDVMVGGQKVAGILIESGFAAPGVLWLAIGVGVNLLTPPTASERPATALSMHLKADVTVPPTPSQALAILSDSLRHWLKVWDDEGVAAVLQAWTSQAQGIGERCEVRLERATLEGTALGIDPDGAFRLRLLDGTIQRISAGDVFFPRDVASGAG